MKTLEELLEIKNEYKALFAKLSALKNEYGALFAKLSDLSEEELCQVTGGDSSIRLFVPPKKDDKFDQP